MENLVYPYQRPMSFASNTGPWDVQNNRSSFCTGFAFGSYLEVRGEMYDQGILKYYDVNDGDVIAIVFGFNQKGDTIPSSGGLVSISIPRLMIPGAPAGMYKIVKRDNSVSHPGLADDFCTTLCVTDRTSTSLNYASDFFNPSSFSIDEKGWTDITSVHAPSEWFGRGAVGINFYKRVI